MPNLQDLKYVTKAFYSKLKSLDERISLFRNDDGLDKTSLKNVRSLMIRIKSDRRTEENIPYGILDEIDNPSVLRTNPWAKAESIIGSMKSCLEEKHTEYIKCLEVITDSRKTYFTPVHELNLDASYEVLNAYRVVKELNKVNTNNPKPFGLEFLLFSMRDGNLVENFHDVSKRILTRSHKEENSD